jgi:hypothetical protein
MRFQQHIRWLVAILFLLPRLGVQATGPAGMGEQYNFFRLYRVANKVFGLEQTVWAYGNLPISSIRTLVPTKGSAKDGTLNAVEWLTARSGNAADLTKIPPGMDLDDPSLSHFIKYGVDAGQDRKVYTASLMGWKDGKIGEQPGWGEAIQKYSKVLTAGK